MNKEYEVLIEEIDRLNKRCERLDGKRLSVSLQNENLITLNNNLKIENKNLKKDNMIIKRVNDELAKDIFSLKNTIKVKNDLIDSKNDEIKLLEKKVEELTKENSRLKAVIAKDVENSSIPSSINVYKKKVQNNREKSSKPKGGQVGHKGYSLEYLNPTKITVVNHEEFCPKCGEVLNTISEKKKQLVDALVELKIEEFQIKIGKCPKCGYISKPDNESNLVNNVTYGKSLKAMVVLLNTYGLVSINRTSKMFSELTGGVIKLAESTICNIIKEASKKCVGEIEFIKNELVTSPILHVDETPIRTEGKLGYVHVVSNNKLTLLSASKTRGKTAVEEIGVLNKCIGTLVSDHFVMYYNYGTRHQECNAHILRYLKGVSEIEHGGWSQDMISLLTEILHRRKELINNGVQYFSKEDKESYTNKYVSIISKAKDTYFEKTIYNTDSVNLYKRMEKYKENHLLFMNDFSIPFENNQAERDVRMLKSKTKVSGHFNMLEGAQDFLNIRSVLQSCTKQKKNIFHSIKRLFDGEKIFI